jgi:membrane fusion protein (multidrug efflux system)
MNSPLEMIPYSISIMNRFAQYTAAALFAAILFAGCSDAPASDGSESTASTTEASTNNDSAADARTVRSVRVSTRMLELATFEEIIPMTGNVSAPEDASLSAQAAGSLTYLAEVGTQIEEGEVVARLDDRLVRAALDQAHANLTSAESQANLAEETLRRQEPLYQDSIISALEYEGVLTQRNQARAALAQAEAAVAQAQQQLENTYVRAPFPGTVEERFMNPGEQVMPGSPVLRVVNTRNLKVVAGVPETYAADIRRGTPVTISFRAYAGGEMQKTVSFVGSVINPRNRTFSIEIAIDNPSGVLKPAMIADLEVTRQVMMNQIVVPQTAILRDENGMSVYLAVDSPDGKVAQRRPIVLGPSYNGRTVVSSGLQGGEEIIIAGQTSVTEGDAIEVTSS